MQNHKVGETIKAARLAKGWTQKQLADAVGISGAFVAKLETGDSLPSYGICLAIAGALDIATDELWEQVEAARSEASKQRLQTRNAAIRGALKIHGIPSSVSKQTRAIEMSADEIAREIEADAELRSAYDNLRTALADSQLRVTVLQTLSALANSARMPKDNSK